MRYTIYESRYGEIGLAWRWIDDNINHARVAYVGDARMLAAYGADLSNEVRYINTEGELEERYDDHYYHHPGTSLSGQREL